MQVGEALSLDRRVTEGPPGAAIVREVGPDEADGALHRIAAEEHHEEPAEQEERGEDVGAGIEVGRIVVQPAVAHHLGQNPQGSVSHHGGGEPPLRAAEEGEEEGALDEELDSWDEGVERFADEEIAGGDDDSMQANYEIHAGHA